MNDHWHEQIQRYVNGQASAAEAAALQAALKEDADLRALYLDYMNLDVALDAAAEMVTITENGTSRTATFPELLARPAPPYWRWLAATAACVAFVMLVLLPRQRGASREHADIAATIVSTQNTIARLSVETASTLPAWMSPTASLLNQPDFPQ
ncbi:MAG: hypothetical protein WCO56_04785 [Verrucomicrobiota bacterium]